MTKLNIYTKKYVLFLDVLGFKEYTTSDEKSEEFAEKMLGIFYNIQKGITEVYSDSDTQVSQFSDTFVVSSTNFLNTISIVLAIQESLLKYCSVLTRGAITYGKVFHNGSQFIGPAINRAYELETSYATYPRVIIDDVAIKQVKKTNPDDDFSKVALKDLDGWYYIDSTQYLQHLNDNQINTIFHKLHEEEKKKESYWKVRAKYLWLESKYFNTQ